MLLLILMLVAVKNVESDRPDQKGEWILDPGLSSFFYYLSLPFLVLFGEVRT